MISKITNEQESLSLINAENMHLINQSNFDTIALDVFRYQYEHNSIYQQYCNALRINVNNVKNIIEIPFLPISFFKTHKVVDNFHTKPELTFASSGTTGEQTSSHYVSDASIYTTSLLLGFEKHYGSPEQYAILGLLPSYLERKNASLVHMVHTLMNIGNHSSNGFYINEWDKLAEVLTALESKQQKTILIGVTFALLDFAEAYSIPLKNTIIMETGGMKGRKKEMIRAEVHEILTKKFGVSHIHSEYGMTELLSQGYSKGNGLYETTPTMKVFCRDINDPLSTYESGSGCINVIDLANIHSCSFIATEDLGTVYENGSFEVLGRMDHTALRGCSLLTA